MKRWSNPVSQANREGFTLVRNSFIQSAMMADCSSVNGGRSLGQVTLGTLGWPRIGRLGANRMVVSEPGVEFLPPCG